ncbi:helix-turn-helix domain-containing protein [Sphingobacterium chungjuense]|uniref:helix-turn-helix domain-containing protein n=1 Tax=Sphingobacterium chungjuense TaxID=2675553 RepID=UPI00140DB247|nr:helix-turn-helix domain-containing protein [Sphingobacterium chungjuense]
MVDDNVDIRNYVARILEKDFQVFALSGKPDAERFLSDIQPIATTRAATKREASELELSTKITSNMMWNHAPVILLIASSSPDMALNGLRVDADSLFAQPFDKDLLLAHVQSLLQQQNQQSDHPAEDIPLQKVETRSDGQKNEFLEKVTHIVEKHLDDPKFNVQMLAEASSMSHSNFYRRIKSLSGKSANEFIRLVRLKKVAQLLVETEYNVSEAAFAAGFNDIKYFRAKFLKLFGMKPSEYKKKYLIMQQKQQVDIPHSMLPSYL